MSEEIKLKRSGKPRASVLLLQDNAHIHTKIDKAANSSFGLLHFPFLYHIFFRFLNLNSTWVVAVLETMMMSYVLCRDF